LLFSNANTSIKKLPDSIRSKLKCSDTIKWNNTSFIFKKKNTNICIHVSSELTIIYYDQGFNSIIEIKLITKVGGFLLE